MGTIIWITSPELYVVFEFLGWLALYDATGAASGLCVNVAHGDASFPAIILANIKVKSTKKMVFFRVFFVDIVALKCKFWLKYEF